MSISKINQKRIQILNNRPVDDGSVVYWMNRDCRVHDNWALLYAKEQADLRKVPLIVVYNLVENYLGGGDRQWNFKVQGLIEVQKTLENLDMPFFVLKCSEAKSGSKSGAALIEFFKGKKVGQIITDFSPVRAMRTWTEHVAKHADVQLVQVDTHNVVPVRAASEKREFGAYTIRPKINRLLPEFLTDFSKLSSHTYNGDTRARDAHDKNYIRRVNDLEKLLVSLDDSSNSAFKGGEKEAEKALKHFIKNILPKYHLRNDPNADAQSNLSPYLHYGHISAQRIALEIEKLKTARSSARHDSHQSSHLDSNSSTQFHQNIESFLEELIVRRELADNFCWYASDYDKTSCFPDWAQKNLLQTKDNKRDYIYTKKQFEKAETHDNLWNAAQVEMTKTGKMHGYMRMYWAKKILEWTPDVQTAMDIAIELNDTYELDGRDPNGYAGIAWSLGGVHDRAWFGRPVFGKVRYMNDKGCRTKFDVDTYIEKWLGSGAVNSSKKPRNLKLL